jgi:hypothetical protein
MKKCLLILRCIWLSLAASAQTFSIDWSTIDGGGGTSTGGPYSISGTIGQPEAGAGSGGNFTVVGGFWSVAQEVGLPQLKLQNRGNSLVLSWPAYARDVVVQTAARLTPASGDWSDFVGTPVQVGDHFELVVGPANTPPSPIRFFRLRTR